MLKLITILESLKTEPRRLTDEENLYLDHSATSCGGRKATPRDGGYWNAKGSIASKALTSVRTCSPGSPQCVGRR